MTLPVWKLRPVDPTGPFWRASTHKSEVIIRAATARRARDIADSLFLTAQERVPGENLIANPWSNEDQVSCDRAADGEFPEDAREAILSPAYYDAEFQQKMKAGEYWPAD